MPKFIFTSNNFDTDEIFKMWTAQKVEQGTPYYVGQHGNNYGTWTYSLEMPEFSTADKFISWGWRNSHVNIIPAFIFKTVDKKDFKINLRGGLLLVERCLHSRQTTFDNHFENSFYQDEQYRMIKSLSTQIRNKLLVRLHLHKPSNLVWSDEQRWRDFDRNIELELGQKNIWKLIKESRLTIYSYDSTGLLEVLSLNIPVIGFWYHLLEEILPSAKPYYELLRKVGILFDNPEDAANHINQNWDDIGKWWFSDEVQQARKVFCDQYARNVDDPVKLLKEILMNTN
jgi:putative transferase (TIGR04331 family)